MGILKRASKKLVRKFFDYGLQSYLLDNMEERILRGVARLNSIAYLHQKTFAEFKGIHKGKDIVIVGAGPSVNKFKPIPGCVYIGLNSACLMESIKWDYLFSIDKIGIDKIYSEFAAIDCLKFIGDQNHGANWQIPESKIAQLGNVRRYKTDTFLYKKSYFTYNIDSEPLGNFCTVSLQAMQFALYTNPRRIYLVGIDCTSAGHFSSRQGGKDEIHMRAGSRGDNLERLANASVFQWQQLKDFAQTYYPETEIISVNPVGLRGLFKDLDQ